MVEDDVCQAVSSFFRSGNIPRNINSTHIALIPKVRSPTRMQQLRPISLCNVSYKIVAKVLANRLKCALPHLISGSQSAFVPKHIIHDNILLAHEVMHYLKTSHNKSNKYMAVKLDMSKAYDRVEWSFVEAVMHRMGFNQQWIGWIMGCIQLVNYSVIINGEA